MNFFDFSEQWIEKNVRTSEVYGDIVKEDLIKIVAVIKERRHSGASLSMFLFTLLALLNNYLWRRD